MNFVLNPSSILAASLLLVPMTASAGQDDDPSKGQIHYVTIVDAANVDAELAGKLGLDDYSGPVVVAQTQTTALFNTGYAIQMSFSPDNMGPLADHPIFDLVDTEELAGAPMFLTDRMSAKNLIIEGELQLEDIKELAGMLDLDYADNSVFTELNPGIGEGDYLALTHSPTSSEFDGQSVFGAHVFDPSFLPTDLIDQSSGVRYVASQAVGVVVINDAGDQAEGFEHNARVEWVANGPEEAHSDHQDDGTAGSTNGHDEDSQSEGIEGETWEVPTEAGGQMDLPEFTPSPRSPVRTDAAFAPALNTPVYHR